MSVPLDPTYMNSLCYCFIQSNKTVIFVSTSSIVHLCCQWMIMLLGGRTSFYVVRCVLYDQLSLQLPLVSNIFRSQQVVTIGYICISWNRGYVMAMLKTNTRW